MDGFAVPNLRVLSASTPTGTVIDDPDGLTFSGNPAPSALVDPLFESPPASFNGHPINSSGDLRPFGLFKPFVFERTFIPAAGDGLIRCNGDAIAAGE